MKTDIGIWETDRRSRAGIKLCLADRSYSTNASRHLEAAGVMLMRRFPNYVNLRCLSRCNRTTAILNAL